MRVKSVVILAMTVSGLSGCGTAPEIENAPPAVIDDCRREVALLTDDDILSPSDAALPGPDTPDDSGTVIDEARTAKDQAGTSGLNDWPADALMYRCLASRGIELTREQALVLAEWDQRPNTTSGEIPQSD